MAGLFQSRDSIPLLTPVLIGFLSLTSEGGRDKRSKYLLTLLSGKVNVIREAQRGRGEIMRSLHSAAGIWTWTLDELGFGLFSQVRELSLLWLL